MNNPRDFQLCSQSRYPAPTDCRGCLILPWLFTGHAWRLNTTGFLQALMNRSNWPSWCSSSCAQEGCLWEGALDEVKHKVWGHSFGGVCSHLFYLNWLLIWDCNFPAGKFTDGGNPRWKLEHWNQLLSKIPAMTWIPLTLLWAKSTDARTVVSMKNHCSESKIIDTCT